MSDCGGIYKSLDQTNPFFGVSGTGGGGFNLNLEPSLAMRESLVGSNDNRPARDNATTISGLAIKLIVSLLPSFLPGKFLLKDVTIVFF